MQDKSGRDSVSIMNERQLNEVESWKGNGKETRYVTEEVTRNIIYVTTVCVQSHQ